MDNPLTLKSWSPYIVGALIGVLSWFAFATVDRALGITTAFEYTAALSTQAAMPSVAATNSYYHEPEKDPKIDWEWMLVLGVFVGSMLSARSSGDRTRESVPELWRQRFGSSKATRFAAAFLGGAVMMFGARMAQGCTSGHGISGALQLALSSWIFIAVIFASGALFAALIYRSGGHRHV
jgi:uncharacterized protein